jgi:acyl-CoA dehydrogenase
MLAGNEAQKQKYLTRLASGESLGAFALTEPAAGSDVARLRCRAGRDGDYYILNGSKTFITNGGVAEIITAYAVVDPDKPMHRNAGVFIVEKGMPGFSVGKKENKTGPALPAKHLH